MPPTTVRRVAGGVVLGPVGLLATLLITATPAAAHSAGGALPAPTWLLGYGSVAAVLITAVMLRSSWPLARLTRFRSDNGEPPQPTPVAGGLVGLALLALVIVTALAGLNTQAANPAPWAAGVVFWVGLPLMGVLLGDVFRWINPYVTIVRLLRRPADATVATGEEGPPTWVPAAFLFSFGWYLLAFYRPGSPRALATFLAVYTAVAIGLGLRWGHRWLATGEGFGALSASVARLAPRAGRRPLPRGVAPLMVVWLGATVFDVLSQSDRWIEVLGPSRGWGRTLLDTVGLVWITAIIAGCYLLVVWVAERGAETRIGEPLGVALVPLATGWFLAHDLSLLLAEGQNAYILMSDPFGRGWDLFGTINHTIDYGLTGQAWLRWTQLALLTAGHLAALVVLHDTALRLLPRRAAARALWAMTAAVSGSITAGVLLVLQ